MSSIFGIFAGVYYWYPKMFGRKLNETWGKVHFALTFVFSNGLFFPMHIIGTRLHPRRYYDPTQYEWLHNIQWLNVFMTICALLLGVAQIIFLINFLWSLFRGEKVGRNPWQSNTLEWTAPSPPPHGNFDATPVVYRGPYEYGGPQGEDDHLPQTTSPNGLPAAPVPVAAH
jgi:cytochrome c oxidase subunit 1